MSNPVARDPIDAALLFGALRDLRRRWQERARATSVPSIADAYRQAVLDLEAVVDDSEHRRRSWQALRDDLATTVARRIGK